MSFVPLYTYNLVSTIYEAFVIDSQGAENNVPQRFILTGAGWGHGVGLCQVGAAVMSEKGYSYTEILSHYFTGAELKKYY